jgi:rare lipoprotein A
MLKKQISFQGLLLYFFIFLLTPAFCQEQKGNATFYHSRFWGVKTYSGEAYHPYKFTAAHKYFPMGAWVEVYFPKTKKSTYVRVNDRGPYRRGAVIDISLAAAKEIGLVSYGVSTVRIRLVSGAELSDSLTKAWALRDSIAVSEHPKPPKKIKKKPRKKKRKKRAKVK